MQRSYCAQRAPLVDKRWQQHFDIHQILSTCFYVIFFFLLAVAK